MIKLIYFFIPFKYLHFHKARKTHGIYFSNLVYKLFLLALLLLVKLNASADEKKEINWLSNPFETKAFIQNNAIIENAFPSLKENVKYFTEIDGYLVVFYETKLLYVNEYNGEIEFELEWLIDKNVFEGIKEKNRREENYIFSGKNFQNRIGIAFNEIIYKNLFKGVDLEFTLKDGKIKYQWRLKNGSDYKKIRMYLPLSNSIKLENENLEVNSPSGIFTEKRPISFYEGKKLETKFKLEQNAISFKYENNISNKELIIDPWIINPALAKPQIFEVDYDDNKNVVIQGSCGTYKIVQLNPNGLTNWIHTPSFGILPFEGYEVPGGLTVIRATGTVLVSEGITAYNATTPARVRKLSPSGQIIATVPIHPHIQGIPRIEYVKNINAVLLGCYNADTIIVGQMVVTDTNLVITNGPVDVLGINQGWHAPTLMTVDRNGMNAYFLTEKVSPSSNFLNFIPDTTVDNDIYKIPIPTLSPTLFQTETYYDFSITGNQPYTVTSTFPWGAVTSFSDFFHGITCGGNNDLFIYDGAWVKKIITLSGQLTDSIKVNAQKRKCSGISSDGCDNLFVSAMKNIRCFNSQLQLKDSIPMQDSIYDLLHDEKCTLYACGRSFVASIDAPPAFQAITTTTNASSCYSCDGSITKGINLGCTNGPDVVYSWSTEPNNITSGIDSVCPGEKIIFEAKYCNEIIKDTLQLNFDNASDFSIEIEPDSVHICRGQSLNIEAHNANNFEISPNTNISSLNDSVFIFAGNTDQTLTIIGNTVACYDTVSIDIYVDPVPNASFNVSPEYSIVPQTITVNNTSNGAISYNWFGTHAYLATDSNFTIEETNAGNYSLLLIAQNEFGCTDTAVNYYFIELLIDVPVPNIFSPNNDQINDFLSFETKGIKAGSIQIFNRWGILMNEGNVKNFNWDGKNKLGQLCEEGTYFYVVDAIGYTNLSYKKKGFFNLIK